MSISLSISVTDNTWLAALVTISSEKGSPAVCRVKIESESAIPPELAEVCVTFSPDHLFNADPYVVVVISSTISWVVVVVLFIDPWVKFGVTNSALATVGDVSRKSKNHLFILPFSLPLDS